MINNIPKFFELAKRKVHANNKLAKESPNYIDNGDWNSHKIYIKEMAWELKEASNEIKEKNSVYLEDELWDVFWTYINLLDRLENEWYINSKNVFNRSYKKFEDRVSGMETGSTWQEIKAIQKERLKQEHDNTYN